MNDKKIVVIISDTGTAKKVIQVLNTDLTPVYHLYGQGTASTQLQDLLGLADQKRICTISLLEKDKQKELFDHLKNTLNFRKHASGIAFTIPLYLERRDNMNQNYDYSMIAVAVNEGFSYEVMEEAKKAGAKGGTILKGCRMDKNEKFLGVNLHEEQEILMIVTEREKKDSILNQIQVQFGFKSKAQGKIITLPIEDLIGLAE